MGNTCGRCIFWLYPSTKKTAFTEEGLWLRKMLALGVFIHSGLALTCLAIVGFTPMMINLLQAAVTYSCYLTLREREVWVYVFLLFCQVISCVLTLCGVGEDKNDGGNGAMQVLGQMLCLIFSCLAGFLIGKASYEFRKSGGLHGGVAKGDAPLLLEDKVVAGVKDGANSAAGYANDYMDKDEEY